MKGLVLKGTNNVFSVECEDKKKRTCEIKGKKLKKCKGFYNPLAAGDTVEIEADKHDDNKGLIINLTDRKNYFIRRNQKLDCPQLLAANIDLLLCVISAANPPFRPRFADRILVQAEHENIPVLIVINKIDLGLSKEADDRIAEWKRIGYKTLCVSAKTGESIDELKKSLSGLTSAVTGQSGVGKSSLLNAISNELKLKTAAISVKYDRGTHTTTQGELFKVHTQTKDGETHTLSIIDTPGIRHFSIWGIPHGDIIFYFPELKDLPAQCKFGLSCSHTHEKGCAVTKALSCGTIHEDRYTSWKLLYAETEAALKNRQGF